MEVVSAPSSAGKDLLGSFPRLSNPGALSSDSLNRAYAHVSKNWLPLDPDVVRTVIERLEGGAYETDDDLSLMEDLKQDFALYLFVLREISALPFVPGDTGAHPEKLLGGCSTEQLLEIVRTASFSTQQPEAPAGAGNRLRRERVATGAVCAEIVAERWNLDSEVAFLSAILRQLGIMLIRWNYPHITQRAASKVSDNWDLDDCLEKLLGFSPIMLGIKFALECGFSRSVFYSFYGTSLPYEIEVVVPEEAAGEDLAEAYLTICEISDALVRAGEPESYPLVQMYWEELQQTLIEEVGSDFFDELQQRACTAVSAELHQKHQLVQSLAAEPAAGGAEPGAFARANRHLRSCPIELRDELLKLYGRMNPGHVSHRCLTALLRRVIPGAGFFSGSVFTLNPRSTTLHPLVVIGSPPHELLRAVQLTGSSELINPVAAALRCNLPYRDAASAADGTAATLFTGRIGTTREVGVLALLGPVDSETAEQFFAAFKALRHALNDFLNV